MVSPLCAGSRLLLEAHQFALTDGQNHSRLIGGIRDSQLLPGDEVLAVNQHEVAKRRRQTNTTGKESGKEKFDCGMAFWRCRRIHLESFNFVLLCHLCLQWCF